MNGIHRASLWTGSPGSWVDLHPSAGGFSEAFDVSGGQQVGWTKTSSGGSMHASLWTGSAGSWIDLNPAGSGDSRANGVLGGVQVGRAEVGGRYHAGLWSGSAASWVDLHGFLSGAWAASEAQSLWISGTELCIAGYALSNSGESHAMLWCTTIPEPGSAVLLILAGLLATARRRH